MANNSKKSTLQALATAEFKKTDDQRALEQVQDLVEENQNKFQNDLFAAKKAAKAAVKYAASLESNLNATASDIINADRQAKLAEQTVEDIEAIIARRF